MTNYVVSWSGGKDSCLAHWKATSQGMKVGYLLNMVEKGSTKSMSHGLDNRLISLQAQSMGLSIVQREVTWETYEAEFKSALEKLKPSGIIGLVTGDIYLQEHKDWTDRVCAEIGLRAVLPLWGMNTTQLLTDFIDAGFKAIIVSAKAEFFDKEWLGRQLDKKLAAELGKKSEKLNVDPCGEAGEFHTFVYDGPSFKRQIRLGHAIPALREDRWFLDIQEYSLA
jgi:diphthine-ammonia ligase